MLKGCEDDPELGQVIEEVVWSSWTVHSDEEVCMFLKLHITAQSGPVILGILCHSHWSSHGEINDAGTYYENL